MGGAFVVPQSHLGTILYPER